MENTEDVQQDLLLEETDPYFQYTGATQGQRFLNYFIDNLIMRFTITYVTGYAAGYILGFLFPEYMADIASGNNAMTLIFLAYLIAIINYIIYYTLLEKLFNGKTIGKLVTGTRALRNDGNELTFKDALLRSLSRLVPFEAFSGFGVPWHDSWTDTRVVKTR